MIFPHPQKQIMLLFRMMFFTGMHHPHNAAKVPAAFISAHALKKRKSGFPVRRWVMDSGAFTTIRDHGGYPEPVANYAALIKRFADNGRLLAAVSQDYMCEAPMLAKTGLTIPDHQRLTIERYDELLACDTGGVRIMPVLQGYAPQDYVNHIRQYGDRLKPRMWVGVGSVCKRNANPAAIVAVLLAIKRERAKRMKMDKDFTDAAVARKYIKDFRYILGKDVSYVETSSGRRIDFATMDDEDALWVATQLRSMEVEAARRGRGKQRSN